jgi:serine/threonine protein kinase
MLVSIFNSMTTLYASGHEEEVRNDVAIIQRLTHQYIATVLFWLKEPGACSILMKPVADMDLRCYLKSCTREGYPTSALEKILPWFGRLLDALAFAHRLKIMHRDIKPSNILIKDDQVYLADFRVAKDFTMQGTSKKHDYFVYGTPVYRAPETHIGNPPGCPADVFALGCVFSEMLTISNGKSLDEFQVWRRAPENECGKVAFRANLPKLTQWLH